MRPLSPFAFFGSKTAMSGYISNLIDYDTADTYVEFYGGGAKVLLNKPRHAREIYSEYSLGLCAFFRIIGDPQKARELIYRIHQSEYSAVEFERAQSRRNLFEDEYYKEYIRLSKKFMHRLNKRRGFTIDQRDLKRAIKWKDFHLIAEKLEGLRKYAEQGELADLDELLGKWETFNRYFLEAVLLQKDEYWSAIIHDKKNTYDTDKEVLKHLIEEYSGEIYASALASVSNTRDWLTSEDEMQLAVDTYIVYAQSRDGMGDSWRWGDEAYYYRNMGQLPEISERMYGVQVNCATAISYLWGNDLAGVSGGGAQLDFTQMENVFLYCDPPYLQPGTNKNLGTRYKATMEVKDHEEFVKRIADCKCKAIVSNYSNDLYNDWLTEKRGWHRLEYKTVTTAGNKQKGSDRNRVEILWVKY